MAKKPMVLMILDGWGERCPCADNAISCAHPVRFYDLQAKYPHTLLECSGYEVGLPRGQMGNSEVGHLNIGAGRTVYQEITRICQAIEDGSFFSNPVLRQAVATARRQNGRVHLMGLVSDGGVHSDLSHLFALLQLCKDEGAGQVYVHAFLDGRDVPPQSAAGYISSLEEQMGELGIGRIATLGGRFYGMDRDNRWDRIKKAYDAMVLGEGVRELCAQAAITASYAAGITDEFVEPAVILEPSGQPVATIKDGDSVIFFNFRADRARQISHALVDEQLEHFERRQRPAIHYACMTQYDIELSAPVAFQPQNLTNTLGQVLSQHGLHQLRIAETEKYAHLTFFFNGGVEEALSGEDRILIPSPKIATYDLQPAMSAREITNRTLVELDRDYYDVVFMNYANADMVGHTGIMAAAVESIQVLDECLAQVADQVLGKGGILLITADHGNAEMMAGENGSPFTAHTTSKVPFILVSESHISQPLREGGSLRDIAPTMLSLLGIQVPVEMTGRPLTQL
ncbi:MAG: 2,3-bisphosphoglycerate-independent phosphoglycerate mutase [Syntrophomonas sp.]|nr:2,3-bisphosphoglycerate-independent phosphoglycerate mutase [Syntrophomonas sp.]